MNKALAMLTGLGLGAGLTFLADPDRGKRRRALIRDKANHLSHVATDGLDVARRDLRNRSTGWVARTSKRLRPEPVDDLVLVARVRSKLGRHCSHPSAIAVTALNGRITLSGPVLAQEAGALVDAIRRVNGVTSIVDQLDRHDAADVPALQGGSREARTVPEIQQRYWTPGIRLVAGLSGGGLMLWGLARRGLFGSGLGLTGVALLSRALSNQDFRLLLGMGVEREGIAIQKTITLDAPLEQVYAFWHRLENFPRFMRNIRAIRVLDERRSHWVVTGPAGIPVEWEAEITRTIPNKLISWRSVEGSIVRHEGSIHLQANPDGSTRVHIQMSYVPPAGAVGHAVATLFGADPKHEMDDDLARMKLLIESAAGRTPVQVNPETGV